MKEEKLKACLLNSIPIHQSIMLWEVTQRPTNQSWTYYQYYSTP